MLIPYKCLLSQQSTYYFINKCHIMRHFFCPLDIFCPETLWDSQRNRKPEENEGKRTQKQDKNMHWNFEHVAYTWWWFSLFMRAYSHEPQSQTCFPCHALYRVPHITPTVGTYTKSVIQSKRKKKEFHYIYKQLYFYSVTAWITGGGSIQILDLEAIVLHSKYNLSKSM